MGHGAVWRKLLKDQFYITKYHVFPSINSGLAMLDLQNCLFLRSNMEPTLRYHHLKGLITFFIAG